MRFRKRIKLLPGVTLNLSNSGVSTTLGPRGASVNIGKRGTYLNTGIPGTGLYDRTRLDAPPKAARKTAAVIEAPAAPAPQPPAQAQGGAGWLVFGLGVLVGFVLARLF